MKTRPCRPGDVLYQSKAACGARAWISVATPAGHPVSGTTDDHAIRLRLTVVLPQHDIQSDKEVLGSRLDSGWGSWGDVLAARFNVVERTGVAIAPVMKELQRMADEALATVQSVADAHAHSREAQRTAREAAYAAWRVADDAGDTE